MALRQALSTLRTGNVITEQQHDALLGLMSGKTLSLYWEIRALFYIGVIGVVVGVGAVIKQDFAALGPIAVILAISFASLACLMYCGFKARPYSSAEQPSPTPAFDYLLYAGCALFALDLGAIETQFHWLGDRADLYLLSSALLFMTLAYRFDNRLVLTLALTTFASWCGIKLQSLRFATETLYPIAIAYGGSVAALGIALSRINVKKHFLDVYLNLGVNVLMIALLVGVFLSHNSPMYIIVLIACCAAALWHGARARRFLYVLYAIAYGYIGFTGKLIPQLHGTVVVLLYLIVSSIAVVITTTMISRRFKAHE